MLRTFFFFCLPLIPAAVHAQFTFEYDATPLVVHNSDTLDLAWSGGLNNPQFSDIDVDFDGDLDFFVFDRSSDQVLVFLQETNAGQPYYRFMNGANLHFPADLKYRATCIDYDQDSRKDLFTYGTGGLMVYRNVGDGTNGLQWELKVEEVQSDYWGFVNTLFIGSADIPAIVDVDNDGDIDVLTFHIGGEYMQYHKNQSMELYGIPDSLEFELRNECWGGFREDLTTSFVYLNWDDSPCTTGNVPGAELGGGQHAQEASVHEKAAHAGSTILAIDVDNSGVLDLVIGDIAYPNLHLLVNGGTSPNTNSLMVSVDNSFPSNTLPVSLSLFPASFWVDADFDGIRDLLVAPNARTISQDEQCVSFYKNTGSNAQPNFVYQQGDFLQDEMMDHGTAAIPVLADIDQDGLQDLFMSVFHRFESVGATEGRVAYYRNTGTAQVPVFTLIDADFLNLSALSMGLHLVPTFGDLDGDGDADLLIGLENGTLAYFENTSVLPTIAFAAPVYNYTDHVGATISAGQFAAPQLVDLNKDGLPDLVVGKKMGELLYYENNGTAQAPSFELKNEQLGMIDLAPTGADGYALPHFFEWDDTTYLMLGAADGALHMYEDITDNLSVGSTFVHRPTDYLNIHSGAYSAFFTGDVDQDGHLNLFVGNELGGVRHFEHDPDSDLGVKPLPERERLHVYPNPVHDRLIIETRSEGRYTYVVYDVSGRRVKREVFSGGKVAVDVSDLRPGHYLIRLEGTETSSLGKFVKYGE